MRKMGGQLCAETGKIGIIFLTRSEIPTMRYVSGQNCS